MISMAISTPVRALKLGTLGAPDDSRKRRAAHARAMLPHL